MLLKVNGVEINSYDVVQVSRNGHAWEDYATIRTHDDANCAASLVLNGRDGLGSRYRVVRAGKIILQA